MGIPNSLTLTGGLRRLLQCRGGKGGAGEREGSWKSRPGEGARSLRGGGRESHGAWPRLLPRSVA
uniref:Uncharacterized protein n=1 Tax=Arundo donax TaxID=35708 RepID=A0A0A9C0X2_ARUDO